MTISSTGFRSGQVMAGCLACALCTGLFATPSANSDVEVYDITITHRYLYGPGPFPDQALAGGHVHKLHFDRFMSAKVPAFNNGAREPNVSGERAQGSPVDGKLSDGTKLNEYIEMGNAVILNGQFNLVLGAVFSGPNEGASLFFLDDDYNWTILDDIAMDPGFAEGVVKIDNMRFSTGPKPVPFSIQTMSKYPAGIDRTGTLNSGDVVIGRVGDEDADGHVDGIFFAMGQFPLTSAFLPGAPFVQRVHFTSDIPLNAVESGLLAAASARNCLRVLREPPAGVSIERSGQALRDCSSERIAVAQKHLQRALSDSASCAQEERCKELASLADELQQLERNLSNPANTDENLAVLDRISARLAVRRESMRHRS